MAQYSPVISGFEQQWRPRLNLSAEVLREATLKVGEALGKLDQLLNWPQPDRNV